MKKTISFILILCTMLSMITITTVFAETLSGTYKVNGNPINWTLDTSTKTLTISGENSLFFDDSWFSIYKKEPDSMLSTNVTEKYIPYVEKLSITGFTHLEQFNPEFLPNLKEICLGADITSMNLYECVISTTSSKIKTLETITVADGNSKYVSIDGLLYTKDMELLHYPYSKKTTTWTVPHNIIAPTASIGARGKEIAISNKYIENVYVPEGIGNLEFHISGDRAPSLYIYSKQATGYAYSDSYNDNKAVTYIYKDSAAYQYAYNKILQNGERYYRYKIIDGDFDFTGKFGDNITWSYDKSTQTLTCLGTGAMEDRVLKEEWRDYPYWWFFFNEVKHLVIEEGITHIGGNLFVNSALSTVSLPKTLTSIGNEAFYHSEPLPDLYYAGSQADWSKITLNSLLTDIPITNIHYNHNNNKNFSNVILPNQPFVYDGTEKVLSVEGTLPEGATVTYTNNKGKNAGTYNATAVVSCEGYNTITLNATLKINKAPITVVANDVSIKVGSSIPTFDENSYRITSGKLFGEDELRGTLATDCTTTASAKNYTITKGTLTAGNNYDLTFVNGKLSVVDKTVQNVTVDGVVTEKTYGDDGFKITVTPDATSKLDNFTITSSDANVATVDASGNVTIKGAGITTLSVKEAGNNEYAAFEKTWKLTVNKAKVTITADNITKKIGQDDPKLTYTVDGNLYGEDKVSGELTRTAGEEVGKYDILIGALAISDNYEITFNKGEFEIVDKTPQVITVADIDAKTYGAESFKLEVTPDATSKLDTFTYTSSNVDVADIAADGTVTIKGAGETTITVSQAGNEEYAATEKSVKLVVNPITVTVTTIDMDNKTATIEGVLEADIAGVELDFDNVKTIVISSEKTTVEETTTITSTLKVINFTFKGEKAKNYVADKDASLTTTVVSTTVVEKLTEDENVTIEAAPVDDKTIIVTDVAVAPEAEVKKVTIDVTAIEDTKINTIAVPVTTVGSIIGIDEEVALELTLKDGSNENKASTITLNAKALTAVYTTVYAQNTPATTISISVDNIKKEELESAQQVAFESVATKSPVVYSLNIIDGFGNALVAKGTGGFGEGGLATVKLPYAKPAGNGNVIVKYLDDLGNITNISNPKYDTNSQTVTVELGHFSKYLIYTEPVVSYGGGGVSRYTVKFETNGGSVIKAITVNKNAVVAEPATPTKEGFKFEGWYTNKALTTPYNFSSKVTKNFTLYAKWSELEKEPDIEEPEIKEPETFVMFKDVNESDWFYSNVQYVVENKLMNGVAEDKFAPSDNLTRAMLVTVLYRNADEPAVNKSIPFADVDMSTWYANAVSWAKQNGIVNGVTENEFAPDANITREQIAAIIHRYAQYKGYDVSVGENTNILSYGDFDSISEYAIASMQYACGSGLMKGKTNTTLNPKDNATRAEIATILHRFIEVNK